MTTDWESLGRTLGASLGAFHTLVVCGMDTDATARVGIAVGRAQAEHRRVAIADLLGDAPALRELIEDGDIHGIVDCFLYGVSISRIARPVPGAGDLFVLPTGSELPDYHELFRHERWRRLAAGFREAGGLLVLLAPADAAGLEELVAQTDGAVIVGSRVPARLPVAQVVTILRGDGTEGPKEAATAGAQGGLAGSEPEPVSSPPRAPKRPLLARGWLPARKTTRGSRPRVKDTESSRLRTSFRGTAGIAAATLIALAAATLIALIVLGLAVAPLPHPWDHRATPPRDSLLVRELVQPAVDSLSAADSASTDSATGLPLRPSNPGIPR